MARLKRYTNRLYMRLVALICCVILTLSLLPLCWSLYAVRRMERNAVEARRELLNLSADWIGDSLTSLQNQISSLAVSDANFQELSLTSPTEARVTLLNNSLYQQLTSKLSVGNSGDGIFCYRIGKSNLLLAVSSVQHESALRSALKEEMVQWELSGEPQLSQWIPLLTEDDAYLCYIIHYGCYYIGILRSVSAFMRSLPANSGTTTLFYRDAPVYSTSASLPSEEDSDALVVRCNLFNEDYALVSVIDRRTVLHQMALFSRLSFIFAMLGLILLPTVSLMLRRLVILPLQKLLTHFDGVAAGRMDLRIEAGKEPEEFLAAYRGFDHMMDRIRALQADISAEQAQRQRLELMQLQYQIRPHFFLNSLNLIYHLAQMRKMEPIQSMAIAMAEYFRYAFRMDTFMGPLDKELAFVRSYLDIQKIRLGDEMDYQISLDEQVGEVEIPVFSLATYVENTFKHAHTCDRKLFISIRAFYEPETDEVCIDIHDNGPGFPPEVLEQIRSGQMPEKGNSNEIHVGIQNISQTFQLRFGSRAKLFYENAADGGAMIRIRLKQAERSVSDESAFGR